MPSNRYHWKMLFWPSLMKYTTVKRSPITIGLNNALRIKLIACLNQINRSSSLGWTGMILKKQKSTSDGTQYRTFVLISQIHGSLIFVTRKSMLIILIRLQLDRQDVVCSINQTLTSKNCITNNVTVCLSILFDE